ARPPPLPTRRSSDLRSWRTTPAGSVSVTLRSPVAPVGRGAGAWSPAVGAGRRLAPPVIVGRASLVILRSSVHTALSGRLSAPVRSEEHTSELQSREN